MDERVRSRVEHLASVLSSGTAFTGTPVILDNTCSAKPGRRICVVGAGVVGLTTALQLLQRLPGSRVHIVADKFGTETLSDGAGGLWMPYALGDMPDDLVKRWGKATFEHYMELYRSRDCAAAGVMLTSGIDLSTTPLPDEPPLWADIVPSFRRLSRQEAAKYDPSASSVDGYGFTTIITEGRLYMAWLHKRIAALGGTHERRHIATLDELVDYDVVVNCTGLEAHKLVGDKEMYPIRGQVLRVRAPWVRQYVNHDHHTYIIPNTDTVVLGGTTQKGDWQLEGREEDRARILERCYALVPSLRDAPIAREWVGLRPGRPAVRLDRGDHACRRSGGKATLRVVHNYGHGGSGLTLAWGCAADAVTLVQQALA